MKRSRSGLAGSAFITLLLSMNGQALAESAVAQMNTGDAMASASASVRINVSIPARVMLNVSATGVAGQANVVDEVMIDANRCVDSPLNAACSALGGSGTVYTATTL